VSWAALLEAPSTWRFSAFSEGFSGDLMDFSVGDLVDLHGFYDMLMDVMRFSVGFFLHDFHDFAAQAKVSY
jgi:hypothetical protein